jgi:isocitrate dehydrogenase
MAETIFYTLTDEAPALATYSLLPIVQAFASTAGVEVRAADISLAARILAAFPERLTPEQRVADALGELGALARRPEANIIKLPNISASQPQLLAAIAELQARGYALPDYPEAPDSEQARALRARYDRVKGSAVNPVLREGNSDRRAPPAVKAYARANPHSMGAWRPDSATHVATMAAGDFFHNEQSVTVAEATTVRFELVTAGGEVRPLKTDLALQAGEILDATFMSRRALLAFLRAEIDDARARGLLFSLHLKATMMKVSDPILFGHAVQTYFAPVWERHGAALAAAGADPRSGLGAVLAAVERLPEAERDAVLAAVQEVYAAGPDVAMVDSDRGVTNLHVPSDVIVDASMPAMIRSSGQMWDKHGALRDCKAVLPDSSYAGIYQRVIDDCKAHGAYDVRRVGSVANVGLMAQKAEEYGSHDKTFELSEAGTVRVVDASGRVLLQHEVEAGDVWRACQTKDAPVRDWVALAVRRARATGAACVFWLDEARAHDREVLAKVRQELARLDHAGLELHIAAPAEAMALTLPRFRAGKDTISATGNVLRDYLTDLFPILELGTSAKMLSVVPLMAGGGLFETGAGGSAPKHVQQFIAEGYLRWDSLGEFLALAVALEHLAERTGNRRAAALARALDAATEAYLLQNKSPARRVGQIDNRGGHAFLAVAWAGALAAQRDDAALAARVAPVAAALAAAEGAIQAELLAAQGQPVALGGYYLPDPALAEAAMRPSATLNGLIGQLAG